MSFFDFMDLMVDTVTGVDGGASRKRHRPSRVARAKARPIPIVRGIESREGTLWIQDPRKILQYDRLLVEAADIDPGDIVGSLAEAGVDRVKVIGLIVEIAQTSERHILVVTHGERSDEALLNLGGVRVEGVPQIWGGKRGPLLRGSAEKPSIRRGRINQVRILRPEYLPLEGLTGPLTEVQAVEIGAQVAAPQILGRVINSRTSEEFILVEYGDVVRNVCLIETDVGFGTAFPKIIVDRD